MNTEDITLLAERTWNSFYTDRRPWQQLEDEAKDEWIRMFAEYETQRGFHKKDKFEALLAQSPVKGS